MRKIFTDNSIKGSNAGTTLVEIVVSMVLTAIFATAIVAVMSPATRIFTQVQDMSRAQMVADTVVDALREECANTYIEDFASARIVNASATDLGDSDMMLGLNGITSSSDSTGNVLLIRRSAGYCEAIYSDISISANNYNDVRINDSGYIYDNGISSRAVYRFFDTGSPSRETEQGYVHYAFYKCGFTERDIDGNLVRCIFPGERYDYTNPFSLSAYNGYTVSISFSNLTYTLAPGVTTLGGASPTDYVLRPSGVTVTVQVYKARDYAGQSPDTLVYTRTARLVFAEDNTK
ncbi:MAG: hypothetical protein K5871_10960 [Lachnospiraceae bacterium]|nr:hypothetical protein [Lachnospiraceae bacterium]